MSHKTSNPLIAYLNMIMTFATRITKDVKIKQFWSLDLMGYI
jgi:hypothetical protein